MSHPYPQDRDPRRQQPQPWPQQQPQGYSQNDYYSRNVQPNVQRNIPEQWQGKPGFRRHAEPPQWRPPVIEQYDYPERVHNRRPPYPSHLVQFPAGLIGFGGGRSRGPSFWRLVYLGTHPVALLMTLFLFMIMVEFIAGWIALVLTCWLLWVMIVTAAWGCQVAVSALGGRRGRI